MAAAAAVRQVPGDPGSVARAALVELGGSANLLSALLGCADNGVLLDQLLEVDVASRNLLASLTTDSDTRDALDEKFDHLRSAGDQFLVFYHRHNEAALRNARDGHAFLQAAEKDRKRLAKLIKELISYIDRI